MMLEQELKSLKNGQSQKPQTSLENTIEHLPTPAISSCKRSPQQNPINVSDFRYFLNEQNMNEIYADILDEPECENLSLTQRSSMVKKQMEEQEFQKYLGESNIKNVGNQNTTVQKPRLEKEVKRK